MDMFWMPDLFFACFFRLVRTQFLKSRLARARNSRPRLETYRLPYGFTDEAKLAGLPSQ